MNRGTEATDGQEVPETRRTWFERTYNPTVLATIMSSALHILRPKRSDVHIETWEDDRIPGKPEQLAGAMLRICLMALSAVTHMEHLEFNAAKLSTCHRMRAELRRYVEVSA